MADQTWGRKKKKKKQRSGSILGYDNMNCYNRLIFRNVNNLTQKKLISHSFKIIWNRSRDLVMKSLGSQDSKAHLSLTCSFQEHLECCHPTSRWDWEKGEGSCQRFIQKWHTSFLFTACWLDLRHMPKPNRRPEC